MWAADLEAFVEVSCPDNVGGEGGAPAEAHWPPAAGGGGSRNSRLRLPSPPPMQLWRALIDEDTRRTAVLVKQQAQARKNSKVRQRWG